ncbi:MAG: hypothetical protein CMK72_13860 [Pseudomonadaceae bacterium]|nr:hypothetical protein [Pseudomonadaceae bacterium]
MTDYAAWRLIHPPWSVRLVEDGIRIAASDMAEAAMRGLLLIVGGFFGVSGYAFHRRNVMTDYAALRLIHPPLSVWLFGGWNLHCGFRHGDNGGRPAFVVGATTLSWARC